MDLESKTTELRALANRLSVMRRENKETLPLFNELAEKKRSPAEEVEFIVAKNTLNSNNANIRKVVAEFDVLFKELDSEHTLMVEDCVAYSKRLTKYMSGKFNADIAESMGSVLSDKKDKTDSVLEELTEIVAAIN